MSGLRGWALLAALAGIVLLPPVGCTRSSTKDKGDGGLPAAVEPTVEDLLAQVGPGVVTPALTAFDDDARALRKALEDWEAAVKAGSGQRSARDDARTAYIAAQASWQQVEMMQIGPLGPVEQPGGLGLRDEIYSWPTINPCRVDQETAEEAWNDKNFFDANLVNSYGLDAIEHLLYAGPDNACPSQVSPNADGAWARLGANGVEANRAYFAVALGKRVVADSGRVLGHWSARGGDFGGVLADADDSGVYESDEDALQAVFGAFFYLDKLTKDRKLAQPLGLLDCGTPTCLDDIEGVAGDSVARIDANLQGFRVLFTGGDGTGFDDLLAELGHEDLSVRVLDAVDKARAAAADVSGPLDDAIQNDTADVKALHAAVKDVTDLLKGDLATVITLDLPNEAAGDND